MTAIIPVNDKYRVELDVASWQVSRWRNKTRHPEGGLYEGITWHRTLQQAGESLVRRLVAEQDLEGVQEVVEAIADASRLVAAAIERCPYPDSWLDAQTAVNGGER